MGKHKKGLIMHDDAGKKIINPADALRKKYKKKKLERFKKGRLTSFETKLLQMSPQDIEAEIRALKDEKARKEAAKMEFPKFRQDQLTRLEVGYKRLKQKVDEKHAERQSQPRSSLDVDFEELKIYRKYSIFYHPVMNPYGAPPTGQTVMYRHPDGTIKREPPNVTDLDPRRDGENRKCDADSDDDDDSEDEDEGEDDDEAVPLLPGQLPGGEPSSGSSGGLPPLPPGPPPMPLGFPPNIAQVGIGPGLPPMPNGLPPLPPGPPPRPGGLGVPGRGGSSASASFLPFGLPAAGTASVSQADFFAQMQQAGFSVMGGQPLASPPGPPGPPLPRCIDPRSGSSMAASSQEASSPSRPPGPPTARPLPQKAPPQAMTSSPSVSDLPAGIKAPPPPPKKAAASSLQAPAPATLFTPTTLRTKKPAQVAGGAIQASSASLSAANRKILIASETPRVNERPKNDIEDAFADFMNELDD